MATNANANGIPFLKRTGIPPAIKNSMVVYYDIKKQGCTNESMKANPVLKDFSGNGNDGQCNNFAWNNESGIGDFVFKDFDKKDSVIVQENKFICTITSKNFVVSWGKYYGDVGYDTPATKIRVTGLKDNLKLIYYYRNSEGTELEVHITKDGNYNLSKSFNTVEGTGLSTGFRINNDELTDAVITIEQLDYYKDAICTDGVDDYIYRDLGGKPDNATVVFDVDWSIEDKGCGINVFGNLAIYNRYTANNIYIKNKNNKDRYPKTIIAVSSDNKIYENNLNVITHNIEQEATFNTQELTLGGKSNNVYTKMYIRRIAVFNRVLTADEIKYVYENIFGCKLKTMEERVEDSIILHYDVAKQSATNESMKTDPRLIDLSGHGYDAKLNNFAWTEDSGINTTTYPNALVSDGVDDYGVVEDLPLLVKEVGYTVIAKRKWLNTELYTAPLLTKRKDDVYQGDTGGAFQFERERDSTNRMCYSFGGRTDVDEFEQSDITYQTSKYYNNISITKGSGNDVNMLGLFCLNPYVSSYPKSSVALYSLMLFNRDLTTEEIEFVKQKYFSD